MQRDEAKVTQVVVEGAGTLPLKYSLPLDIGSMTVEDLTDIEDDLRELRQLVLAHMDTLY